MQWSWLEKEKEKKGVSGLVGLSGCVRDDWGGLTFVFPSFSFLFFLVFVFDMERCQQGKEREKEREKERKKEKKKSTNMMHRFNIDRKPRIRSLPLAFGSGEPVFLLGKIVCFSILNGKNDEFICVRPINQSILISPFFFFVPDFAWDNR